MAEKLDLNPEQLRRLQLKGLEIMLYFKKFCDENNLLFYLCGGGCIGAIRHGGFIPWDDDLDAFMPREDYEKLFSLWNEKANTKKYSCIKTTKKTFAGNLFTVISDNETTLIKPWQENLDIPKGVTIDIFPLDGCPKNKFSRRTQMFWALIYSLYLAQIPPSNHGKAVKFLGNLLLKLIPTKKLRYKIWKFAEKQMTKHKIADCECITELCAGPVYMKNEYPKEIFASAVLKNFEGEMLPLPVGYDAYLKMAFGDYMKLPPKEKQKPHHDAIFMKL